MSKKHHKEPNYQPVGHATLSHEQEYQIIKYDLIKVLALNLVYLAVIMGLFYANRSSHFLDKWASRLF